MFIWGIIVGAIVGVLVLSGIAVYSHSHKFKPTAVAHMTKTTSDLKMDVTEVLYVCPCGDAKTKEFVGSWSLDRFQLPIPAESDKNSDIAKLRKMAGLEDS